MAWLSSKRRVRQAQAVSTLIAAGNIAALTMESGDTLLAITHSLVLAAAVGSIGTLELGRRRLDRRSSTSDAS